jgi:hypothetical protein
MAGMVLGDEDHGYFVALMRRQMNSAVHRLLNVLLLLDDGWAVDPIAEALFIEAETMRAHHRRYLSGGRHDDGVAVLYRQCAGLGNGGKVRCHESI